MIKTLTMLATAATIGIGIAAPSNAFARVLNHRQAGASVARTYRPPAGQIYERGFRDARTPEQAERRDFQLDGAYE
jgi:hypothetical protein